MCVIFCFFVVSWCLGANSGFLVYLVKVFVVRLMAQQVTVCDCAAERVDKQNILKLQVSSWQCATESSNLFSVNIHVH